MDFYIQGIPVNFPYKPYGCQLSIMNRAIEALESGRNCLLESPTGTGKTLSLLCASLAWLNKKLEDKETAGAKGQCDNCANNSSEQDFSDEKKTAESEIVVSVGESNDEQKESEPEVPKIYFCTRTHKQISQIIRELRKTKYRNAKMTILSSRQHTCINPLIKKSSNITEACQNLLQSGVCEFDQPRKKSDLVRSVNKLDAGGPWDIEDLVAALTPVPTCPYFCSRKLMKTADIVFCPYNYLLDPINRSATMMELTGHVVILDEAHNIEDVSRESASFKITDHQLLKANEDLESMIQQSVEKESCEQLISMITAMLHVMHLTRSRLVLAGESAQPTQVWTGSEISGLMGTVGLGPEQILSLENAYRKLSAVLNGNPTETFGTNQNSDSKPKLASSCLHLMNALFVVLGYMFRDNQKYLGDFRLVLMETVNYERKSAALPGEVAGSAFNSWKSKQSAKSRFVENRELSLNFWCLNPALVFREVASMTHCLILMSGTLSPLDALEAELGVEFPIRLEANHVVAKDRMLVASLAHGPGGNRLCATYQHQSTYAFQDEVGNLVLQACHLVPGGVLCFLPSYGLLDKLVQRWETTQLLTNLRRIKHVMIEPRSSVGLDAWLDEFYAAVDQSGDCNRSGRSRKRPRMRSGLEHEESTMENNTDFLDTHNGAVVFAVCRGKVSEGLDFADAYGRLVISIGIPYPAFNNPQVQQKREFNDAARRLASSTVIASPKLPQSPSSSSSDVSSSINRVLSGSEWYNAQAYRALNQALGRCIRHTEDWGAILLADARFVEQPNRYLSGISRWIRSRITHHTHWSELSTRLHQFIDTRTRVAKVEHEAQELDDIFAD